VKEVISIILSLVLILSACCKRNNPVQRTVESVQQARIPKNANALGSSQKTGSTGILVLPSQNVGEYGSNPRVYFFYGTSAGTQNVGEYGSDSKDEVSEQSKRDASFSGDQETPLSIPEPPVPSQISVPTSNKCPQKTIPPIPTRTKNPPPIPPKPSSTPVPSEKEKSILSLVLLLALTVTGSILVLINYYKAEVKPDTRVVIGGDTQYITCFTFLYDRFTSLFHRKSEHVGQLEETEEEQEFARGEGESQSEEEVTNEEDKHEDLKRDDKIVTQSKESSQLEVKEGEQKSVQGEDVPQGGEEVANEEGKEDNCEDLKQSNEIVAQNEEDLKLEGTKEEQESAQDEDVPLAEVIELCLDVTLRWAKDAVEFQNRLKESTQKFLSEESLESLYESFEEEMMIMFAQYAKSSKANLDDLISYNFYVLNEKELSLLKEIKELLELLYEQGRLRFFAQGKDVTLEGVIES
jgi:hypothetical protein